jgi:hypothetical protein
MGANPTTTIGENVRRKHHITPPRTLAQVAVETTEAVWPVAAIVRSRTESRVFSHYVPQQVIALGPEVVAIFVLFHYGCPRHLIVYEFINDRYALSTTHFLGFAF